MPAPPSTDNDDECTCEACKRIERAAQCVGLPGMTPTQTALAAYRLHAAVRAALNLNDEGTNDDENDLGV